MENKAKETCYVDAFGIYHCKENDHSFSLARNEEDRFLAIVEPVLDPKTGNTTPKMTGKKDIYEETQSYKDQTGMAGALLAISRGTNPLAFADDGQHGVDITGLPDNINDAYQNAQEAKKDYSGGLSNADYQAMVDKIVADAQAKIAAAKAEAEASHAQPAVKSEANNDAK